MRSSSALLARLLDASPAKAAVSAASTAMAFPLHQAERVLKRARGAAESGVHVGLRAATGVMGALSSARPAAKGAAPDDFARPIPPVPPARVPPQAAARLPADVAAEPAAAQASELHVPGEDVFPIKNYYGLTAAEVVVAIRSLERQADVLAVLARERANRNRKSVATAGETRIAQLDRLDVRT